LANGSVTGRFRFLPVTSWELEDLILIIGIPPRKASYGMKYLENVTSSSFKFFLDVKFKKKFLRVRALFFFKQTLSGSAKK
jgi:hypothetical protein